MQEGVEGEVDHGDQRGDDQDEHGDANLVGNQAAQRGDDEIRHGHDEYGGKTESDALLQPDDFIIVPSRLINL